MQRCFHMLRDMAPMFSFALGNPDIQSCYFSAVQAWCLIIALCIDRPCHMADESEGTREECLIAVPPPSSAPAMYGWLPSLVRAFLRDRVRLNGCKAAWTADCDDRQTSPSHGGPNSP